MEKDRGIKTLSVIALIIAVIGLSIAFAALSTTLIIDGATKLDSASWDIHFENLSAPTITGNAKELKRPTLSTTSIIGYEVALTKPGDSVTYEFDVKNAGSINAMIGSFAKQKMSCTSNNTDAIKKQKDEEIACNNITYELRYKDNNELVGISDELNVGKSKRLVLIFKYNDEAEEIPSSVVEIGNSNINIIYVQK